MKATTQIKKICGKLATVSHVPGQKIIKVSFQKNFGHGKLGGDKTQGTLGQLAAAGFIVETGHYGNEYTIAV